ncbi:hypothetical protein BBP40_006581 [Aspergillus hancockii]|nr:hypothetical protein BBP40_006581 [Aspergillus hancockii]
MYNEAAYPDVLRLVVHFVGSHFSSTISSDSLRTITAEAIQSLNQQDYHLVQARFLFAIALHSRNEIKESVSVLTDAVFLAIDLGMNRRDFASRHGSRAIEEELIRTDMVGAPKVLLPCDEALTTIAMQSPSH